MWIGGKPWKPKPEFEKKTGPGLHSLSRSLLHNEACPISAPVVTRQKGISCTATVGRNSDEGALNGAFYTKIRDFRSIYEGRALVSSDFSKTQHCCFVKSLVDGWLAYIIVQYYNANLSWSKFQRGHHQRNALSKNSQFRINVLCEISEMLLCSFVKSSQLGYVNSPI